jgi:hypothetical protein
MPVRLTAHARQRAEQYRVTRDDIEELMARASVIRVGETAVEYDGTLRETPFRVVALRESSPPLIITVHPMVP